MKCQTFDVLAYRTISDMAQGRWYVLSDGGNGSLKGLAVPVLKDGERVR